MVAKKKVAKKKAVTKEHRIRITWEPYEVNPQSLKSNDPRGLIAFIDRLTESWSKEKYWVIDRGHVPQMKIALHLLPLGEALSKDILAILDILKTNESIKMWAKY